MKGKKKLFSIMMAVVLCLSFSVNVFAASSVEKAVPEKHVVTLKLAPGDSIVSPAMWNSESHSVGPGITRFTTLFTIPDRYFAYEVTATGSNQGYSVSLMYTSSNVTASIHDVADGSSHKLDWIQVSTNHSYQFRIINDSSTSSISVTITYYSWK